MLALFIGQAYIDVTMLANAVPTGDDKAVANDYAISFGGNAVTAAFASRGTRSASSTRSPSIAASLLGNSMRFRRRRMRDCCLSRRSLPSCCKLASG